MPPTSGQKHGPRRRWIIHPYDRVYWDIFVFSAIIASAFEIPYDWLVGWENETISTAFDLLFFTVFFIDMILNSLTMRERSFGGYWGVRHVLGLLHLEWSAEHHRDKALESNPKMVMVLDSNPDIVRAYFKSAWFLIDLLSTIPWGFLAVSFSPLTSLRLLRLLRLARLFRVLRLTKAIFLLERIRRSIPSVPSVERLLFIAMSIPWLAHLLACLFIYFEKSANPESSALPYGSAFHSMWMALISRRPLGEQVTDPSFFLGMFAVVVSVFVVAAVTGNLAALYTSLDFGKRSNNQVVLEGHSIIIGWSNSVFSVVQQLMMADQHGVASDIVLLSNKTEAEVWKEFDEFGLAVDPRRVTIHTGSIHAVHNIRRLSVGRAHNIIVLGQPGRGDSRLSEQAHFRQADSEVLKALLACCNAFNLDDWARVNRRKSGRLTMVASVHSDKMVRVLQHGIPRRTAEHDFLDIHIIDTKDVLSRCVAQVAAEPLLSKLFDELFSYTRSGSFGGRISHEIYIIELDELVDPDGHDLALAEEVQKAGLTKGITFGDLVEAMPECVPIGFYTKADIVPEAHRGAYSQRDAGTTRHLFLNPGFRSDNRGCAMRVDFEVEHALGDGDALVVVARSRQSARVLSPMKLGKCDRDDDFRGGQTLRAPRRLVVLGNGSKAQSVLELLPDFLPRHSMLLAEFAPELGAKARQTLAERDIVLGQVAIKGIEGLGDETADADLEGCDTVVVISDGDDRHAHDAEILMALTALESRHHLSTGAARRHERAHVIELLDAHNVELAEAFGQVSSLISSELVSNYLVQVANNPERGLVYKELLDIEGNEFYILPLSRYLRDSGENVSFHRLSTRARALGEIAVGYVYVQVDDDVEKHLRLCPTEEYRFRERELLARLHGERLEGLVVIAPRYPEEVM